MIKTFYKETIEEKKNSLLYSVPYRPKTNAIESWFSQFKHYFKHDETGISFQELTKAVKKAIRKIPKDSYHNYMKYPIKTKKHVNMLKNYLLVGKCLKVIKLSNNTGTNCFQ